MKPRPNYYFLFSMLLCGAIAGSSPVSAAAAPRATRTTHVTHATVKKYSSSRYGVPTFTDSEKGDVATYDDPIVRKAAVDALGRYNGSVVAIDPKSGRILTIV